MFGWLFGKKQLQPERTPAPDKLPEEAPAIVRLQRDYWTYRPEEHAALRARDWQALSWAERLRLHHLHCLEVIQQEPFRRELAGDDVEPGERPGPTKVQHRCRESAERLLAPDSPCRPRYGMVWQGMLDPQERRQPDLEGDLVNPSLTHLGCLEVMRLNEQMQPRELAFVPFDDIHMLAFASPKLFRAARLFYDDGRPSEVVFVPLLYGLSWHNRSEYHRSGRLTSFFAYPGGDGPAAEFGMGLGQQDLSLKGKEQRTLFGLGSVAQLAFALDIADPRFDLKCRARGLDPDEVRRRMPQG
jgi:hypothetical protein